MPGQQVKGTIWGARREPVLDSQVLGDTPQRYQHLQRGPHFRMPATEGHQSPQGSLSASEDSIFYQKPLPQRLYPADSSTAEKEIIRHCPK